MPKDSGEWKKWIQLPIISNCGKICSETSTQIAHSGIIFGMGGGAVVGAAEMVAAVAELENLQLRAKGGAVVTNKSFLLGK